MESITDKFQKLLSRNKRKSNIMRVGDTILYSAAEADTDKNWCLLDKKSTYKAFINIKYLSNIGDNPSVQYLCVHFNAGVTYTNKISYLPG